MPNLRWMKNKGVYVPDETSIYVGSTVYVEGRRYEVDQLPSHFTIYRTYSRLVKAYLRKREKPTLKRHGEVDALPLSKTSVRTDPFLIPAPGMRLRAPMHVVDDLGYSSPTMYSTRLGGIVIKPGFATATVGSAAITTAIDPLIELTPLLPWPSRTDDTVHSVIGELAQDVNELLEEDLSTTEEMLLDFVRWALPDERPDSWEIWIKDDRAGLEEGETGRFEIGINAPTPGAAAFAIQATAIKGEMKTHDVVVSDVMVVESDGGDGEASIVFA